MNIQPLDFDGLIDTLGKTLEGKDERQIEKDMTDRSSTLFMLSRLFNRYSTAKEESRKFGYIGVGSISFAENRLIKFQERLIKRYTK